MFYFIVGLFLVVIITTVVAKFIFNSQSKQKIMDSYEGSDEQASIFLKKYREADLDYFRGTFLRAGLILSLGLWLICLIAIKPESEKLHQSSET